LSGTRHLIAVSGLNITIVIAIMWLALSYFLPKRVVFLLTFLAVGCLVAMTGFMVSAVRAAIMGFIAWSAREMIFRPHAVHNSLAFAAAGLVALNPKILVFDIGFQLSFLATAAIIYFAPALKSAFSPSKPSLIHVLGSDLQNREQGFLNWKESFWVTVAAQLAVAPVLISVFQNFSLTSFAANALILPVIPIVMTLGFLIGIAGLIFEPLALAFVFAVYPLIEYAMFLINIFGALAIEFNPQLGLVGTLIYYAVLMFASWKFYNKRTNA
jgi:competence protein ComEC